MSSDTEPDEVDEFKLEGLSSPTSNEVSTAINKLDREKPENISLSGQAQIT